MLNFYPIFFMVSVISCWKHDVPWLEQMQRQELLSHECKRMNISKSVDFKELDHVLVDRKHKFLYCYIPKVACTNWKRLLMVLTGKANATDGNIQSISADKAHQESWQVRLSSLPAKEVDEILNDDKYAVFLMVRHPFERLLSAYRNKLEPDDLSGNPSAKYFQSIFGKRILKKYRHKKSKAMRNNKEIAIGQSSVTFREFVRFLIDEGVDSKDTNEHWRSAKELCLPCGLNYTLVGKYETFVEDAHSVLAMIDAPQLTFPHTRSANTAEKLRSYFRQLDLQDIRKLYQLYEADFKLFGYNTDNILGYDLA